MMICHDGFILIYNYTSPPQDGRTAKETIQQWFKDEGEGKLAMMRALHGK